MRKRKAKDAVRETFTGQRLTLVGWGFSAIFAACLGVAAISFTNPFGSSNVQVAGLKLPEAGPVGATGSIQTPNMQKRYEVFEQGKVDNETQAQRLSESQLDTLYKELVALRRRISMISAQNARYSQRIASLEGAIGSAQMEGPTSSPSTSVKAAPPITQPKITPKSAAKTSAATTKLVPETLPRRIPLTSKPTTPKTLSNTALVNGSEKQTAVRSTETARATKNEPREVSAQQSAAIKPRSDIKPTAGSVEAATKVSPAKAVSATLPEVAPVPTASPFTGTGQKLGNTIDRQIDGMKAEMSASERPVEPIEVVPAPETLNASVAMAEPRKVEAASKDTAPKKVVRQVSLAEKDRLAVAATNDALQTASIPAPKEATPDPSVIDGVFQASSPSGKTKSAGLAALGRSDFGIVIGAYDNASGAAGAWKDFETANVDRMKGLRPLILQVNNNGSTSKFNLLAGPFANAASAAAACIGLREVSPKCRPAIFTGIALPVDVKKTASGD
ncbi:MAG: hypothetical protein HWE23_15385 [Rhodobacteraceae bacterium]|nr:hypothetical protein [Paracoccaceae bacterium]